jgi:hypothetical protein
MSVKRVLFSPRGVSAILLMILASMVGLTAAAQLTQVGRSSDLSLEASIVRMNFHMYRPIYSNSNSSILAYSGADTSPPTYASAPTALLSCAVHESIQVLPAEVDGWIGIMSWITQPLSEDTTIRGNVSMTVWMNTPDQAPAASGYGFGLTEVNSMGNPIGNQFYQYKYSFGSILGSSPTPFTLAFGVDRTFMKGDILGFFVVVGSTTKEWHYEVHFDGSNMNSFADLPTMSTSVPEFSQLGAVTCMMLAMLGLCVMRRRRGRATVTSPVC